MKIKVSEIIDRDVKSTLITFLNILGNFLQNNEEYNDSSLEILYKRKDQINNPHPGGVALNRVMFSIESEKTGVTLFVTHNIPVNGAASFYTLGEEFETISPYEICRMLICKSE